MSVTHVGGREAANWATRKPIRVLLALGLVAMVTIASKQAHASPATSAVSGTVFRDKNQNGVKDSGEQFLSGVFITITGQTTGVDNLLNTDRKSVV